jgi:hypothetical protein
MNFTNVLRSEWNESPPYAINPVFKYYYSDSRNLWTVMRAGDLALKNLIQPTISLEMPVPSLLDFFIFIHFHYMEMHRL